MEFLIIIIFKCDECAWKAPQGASSVVCRGPFVLGNGVVSAPHVFPAWRHRGRYGACTGFCYTVPRADGSASAQTLFSSATSQKRAVTIERYQPPAGGIAPVGYPSPAGQRRVVVEVSYLFSHQSKVCLDDLVPCKICNNMKNGF